MPKMVGMATLSTPTHKHRILLNVVIACSIFLTLWHSLTPNIIRIHETGFDSLTFTISLLWFIVIGLSVYIAYSTHLLNLIVYRLKRNWILLVFISLAIVSITWSIAPVLSIYRLIGLVGATILGIFVGSTMKEENLLGILFWAGVVLVIVCYSFAILYPEIGRMTNLPYNGAWRGIFWHKNELGSLMALFAFIFLFKAVSNIRSSIAIIDLIFFFLAAGLVYLSRSAAGYICLLFLTLAIISALIWVRIQSRLSRKHYLLIGGFVGLVCVFFITNPGWFFSLFNRSSDLTGRVQLWRYLLVEIVLQQTVLGHGFGALWYLDAFRSQVQQAIGWTYPVQIADNGFIDILLHLGWIGLALFISMLVLTILRVINHILVNRTFLSFLPLFIIIFGLLSNISFSLFFEIEYFVWLLMVAALFMSTGNNPPQLSK